MNYVNTVMLAGELADMPVLRYSPQGKATVRLSVKTIQKETAADGSVQERETPHLVVFFGTAAEEIAKGRAQGESLGVRGYLGARVWRDKRGREHRSCEIIGREYIFL